MNINIVFKYVTQKLKRSLFIMRAQKRSPFKKRSLYYALEIFLKYFHYSDKRNCCHYISNIKREISLIPLET